MKKKKLHQLQTTPLSPQQAKEAKGGYVLLSFKYVRSIRKMNISSFIIEDELDIRRPLSSSRGLFG